MSLEEIFKLPVRRHDLNADVPLGAFFYELFRLLWVENQSFNAKRPWGNSGWDYDVYATLIKHGLIGGSLDEDGYIDQFIEEEGRQFVVDKIIKPLFDATTR